MKKLLGIVVVGLLLCGSAFAELYYASSTGFYFFSDRDQVMQATSEISLDDAKKKAINHCKESQMMSKGKPDSCLIYRIKIYDNSGFFNKKIRDEVIWNQEVTKYKKKLEDKKIAEKPKKQEPKK